MAERITDKLVRELTPPPTGNRIVYDDPKQGRGDAAGVTGFGIRITAAGSLAFVLNYRIAGRERRMKIGRYPEWSVEAARKEARGLRQKIYGGQDPLAKREADRAAPTVNDMCDRYIEEYLPTKRASSARGDTSAIEKIIRPKLGGEKVAAVEQTHIRRLHRGLAATPYRANRVLALMSKMFALSIGWKMRGDNPCRGVVKFQERKRNRYLDTAEVARLAKVLEDFTDQKAANVVRLLLLTGARSGEVRGATWDQFNLETGVWIKPGATTKQGTDHRVPLSEGAMALLQGVYEAAPRDDEGQLRSSFVFPGRTGKGLADIKKQWAAISKAAGIDNADRDKGCRIHDLRHTYASILVSESLSLPIIGALLGHIQPQTTARYAHLMDDPLRQATNRVNAIVMGKPKADVVSLREGVA